MQDITYLSKNNAVFIEFHQELCIRVNWKRHTHITDVHNTQVTLVESPVTFNIELYNYIYILHIKKMDKTKKKILINKYRFININIGNYDNES